jgi:phosphohistidine swiveling domain-containing protein
MDYEVKTLKREDIDLTQWEYEFQQRGEQPISLCDFFCRALSQYLIPWITGTTDTLDYLFTDSSKGYDIPTQKQILFKGLREKLDNPEALQHFLKSTVEFPRTFNAEADIVNRAIQNEGITNEELASYWQKMDASFIKLVPWFYYPWYVSKENILTDRVKEGLEKHRKEIEAIVAIDEALLTLVFPIKKTAFQLEQEDMCKLVSLADKNDDFANDPRFKAEAKEYLEKYDWLTTFILSPLLPMSYAQLVERVHKAQKENFKENLEIQKKAAEKNEHIAQRIIEEIKTDSQLVLHIENARELGYGLTAGIEEAYISSSRYLDFMQLVAKRIGVAFVDMKFLLSREIFEALMTDKTVLAKVIEERRKGFAMAIIGGEQRLAVGEEGHAISTWIDTELNKVDTTITELRGQVACKGFVRGKVRVALDPTQAHTLLEGEILVCPMTNPDYVPAMKRSSAIVTDEGGLLSHAAIMSREFNKPCVIATKIATKVLKDGDEIEIDAEKGIVTIIKKSGPVA